MKKLTNWITINSKITTGIWSGGTIVHDISAPYIEETKRCLTFIVQQIGKWLSYETVSNQAVQSYGLWIYDRACKSLEHYFSKKW